MKIIALCVLYFIILLLTIVMLILPIHSINAYQEMSKFLEENPQCDNEYTSCDWPDITIFDTWNKYKFTLCFFAAAVLIIFLYLHGTDTDD